MNTATPPAAPPLPPPANPRLRRMANALRALAMDAVEKANSGHPGMPMGMADAATVLFTQFLNFDPLAPDWPDRDRFVLSAGHGSMLLYGLLHLLGYPDMTLDELKRFRQLGSRTAGHPERGLATGIETTTGPLGQGIANAVGMALAERHLAAEFGDDLVNHYTYAICGDGCLMEGISHEAISLAGHLRLNKLILLWDDNSITIDGSTSLSVSDDQLERFRSHGWEAERIDGLNHDEVAAAIRRAQTHDRPSLIACRTVIAFGAPTKAGTAAAHGSPLGADEIKGAKERLGWEYGPFVVPDDLYAEWRQAGARGSPCGRNGDSVSPPHLPTGAANSSAASRANSRPVSMPRSPRCATISAPRTRRSPPVRRRARCSVCLLPAVPEIIGGSADLTPSNNTKVKDEREIKPGDFAGRYIHFGIREHRHVGGDERHRRAWRADPLWRHVPDLHRLARPAIRLSALMEARVIYVMTHDSIGLGEDGPTHQPVEHLAALRAIPHLLVFRPADPVETAECWSLALKNRHRPSILALTRQSVPLLRTGGPQAADEICCARGAYVLAEASASGR